MGTDEQKQEYDPTVSSTNSKDDLVVLSNLLKVLSRSDTLLIFSMAKDRIEADSRTYSKVGLTRKQYYTRLIQLKKAGLIKKDGKFYLHTTMGSFLQEKCINPIVHAIKNHKKMEMVDVLKSNGKFSDEELSKMISDACLMPTRTD